MGLGWIEDTVFLRYSLIQSEHVTCEEAHTVRRGLFSKQIGHGGVVTDIAERESGKKVMLVPRVGMKNEGERLNFNVLIFRELCTKKCEDDMYLTGIHIGYGYQSFFFVYFCFPMDTE